MSSPEAPKSPAKVASPKSPPKPSPSAPEELSPAPGVGAEEENAIEVDDDNASQISESTGITTTASLRSSILSYKWENGRRYHAYKDGSYWAPNDDRQQEAEDLFHEMCRLIIDGKLYDIPDLEDPQTVLDVGCGTGAWAMDFADEHPSAKVCGVDLSPIQSAYVPPNCVFEIDDINKDWTWPVDNFDLIHIRIMNGSVDNWHHFYNQALRHLKPGGWIHQIELSAIARSDDNTIKPDSPYKPWREMFEKMGKVMGRDFFTCETAHQSLQDAGGFVNVHERRIKIPVGTWPKDKKLKTWGEWNRHFVLQGLEGFSIRGLTSTLGWTYEEAQMFLFLIRKEVMNPSVHSYIEMCVLYGQKPKE